jgi:hypothetical protein
MNSEGIILSRHDHVKKGRRWAALFRVFERSITYRDGIGNTCRRRR